MTQIFQIPATPVTIMYWKNAVTTASIMFIAINIQITCPHLKSDDPHKVECENARDANTIHDDTFIEINFKVIKKGSI